MYVSRLIAHYISQAVLQVNHDDDNDDAHSFVAPPCLTLRAAFVLVKGHGARSQSNSRMPDILFDMSLNFIYTIIFHNLLYGHFKSLSDVCTEYYIYSIRYGAMKCTKQTKTISITSEIFCIF